MYTQTLETVIQLADISDPTSDGIALRAVNWTLAILMLLVVGFGAYYGFQAWRKKAAAGANGIAEVREVAFGVIVIEMFLGGIIWFANYGTSLLQNFGIG
ncbi:Uncharacterised protein (plasmid) [Tsukamurella tyrosinosolvens]|uniref:Uncharacterized protein n=1 Tax=Tsukamurella tyrosinosolvens TaxID=57704 RepID=A0A1H4VT43_TSUTY|nr:hypothetical protein [Tsukamurella tyrosinosolvens]KXO90611.1 hypothetical protein AXK58_22845 [Tsukamurella tyrosinosolvens]SEC84143.1 hypothetical protein SAMN04489793_3328 [Tsukamurella tyrosinosolvens]VEH90313.1 Uncharacterised protein [Tsukamurella tyrosinosolvens]